MRMLVVTNNSSLGAIQSSIAALKDKYKDIDIFVLVEENRAAGFAGMLKDCKIIGYRQGSLLSFRRMFEFYLELRANKYEYFIGIEEKEKNRDRKYDILFYLSGAEHKLVYNAVDGKIYRKNLFDKVLEIAVSRIIIAAVLLFCLPFLLAVYILALPGYIFRGKTKMAFVFFRENILGLAGYLFHDISVFKEDLLLDLLMQFEFLKFSCSSPVKFDKKNIKNILVLKLEHIGDMVLFIPFLRELRKSFPEAKITLLACPWNVKIVENSSYVDEIIVYSTNNPALNRQEKTIGNYLKRLFLLAKLALKGYDLCLDSGGWAETFKIAGVTGAKVKIAVNYGRYPRLFNYTLVEPKAEQNDIQRSFSMFKPLGIEGELDMRLEYIVPELEVQKAKIFLEKNGYNGGRLLGFYAGSSSPARMWPKENFVRLIDSLNRDEIIIFNSPGQDSLSKEIAGKLKKKPIITPESLSLAEFSALAGFCKLFVSEGGGLFHIAAARGVSTIGLFGAEDVLRWGNYTANNKGISKMFPCSPCRKSHCIRNLCMEAIKVEEVLEAVKCVLE